MSQTKGNALTRRELLGAVTLAAASALLAAAPVRGATGAGKAAAVVATNQRRRRATVLLPKGGVMERPIFERLIHVPGPNPILTSGAAGDWDEGAVECCGVLKDYHTYYLYYHGMPRDKKKWGQGSYRIGVATASHPLGPWTKYGSRPLLDLGPEGSWDSNHAACAAVLKERENTYLMWYSGMAKGRPQAVGLATASSPLGPWTKYEKNPIMTDFGYVGGVVKVGGTYFMYAEHPVSENSPDQGPLCLATAERPEGPWERYKGNPILSVEGSGTWDDGGYSEAGVLYHEGVFHTFYGGTKWRKFESIGYAYSFDGNTFHKHRQNPVVMRERCPKISAFAEVHALFEPPLFYLYATQRYITSLDEHNSTTAREDLGANVLATSVPFRFDMPVMTMGSLAGGAATELDACPPIGLENVNRCALTAECAYGASARAGLRVKVYPSYDGLNYDTEPMACFDNAFYPGKACRKTMAVDPMLKFAKVVLENLDGKLAVKDLRVVATLGCV